MKRTFHVCLSLGISGHVSVEAESPEEAKAAVAKMSVCLVELMTGDEDCETVELSEGDNSDYSIYEKLVGDAIDLEAIGTSKGADRG